MSIRKYRDYFWATGEPWNSIRIWLIPRILRAFHSALMCSLRIEATGIGRAWQHDGKPMLIVIWHDKTLVSMHFFRDQGISGMMSTSRAGRLQAAFWQLYGWPVVWGSSKKREGVKALREVLNGLKAGGKFAFTPDGPKGPRHKAQPGAVYLASNSGAVILPIGIAASKSWHLSTWDKFAIPKPFARVHIHMGEPVKLPEKIGRDEMVHWQERVEEMLNAAEAEAERALAAGYRSSTKVAAA